MEDVAEGAAIGPFFEESEVSEFVGDDRWIPTQRFEVVQKNKVRGVDSATSNGINMATVVTEKLELPVYGRECCRDQVVALAAT